MSLLSLGEDSLLLVKSVQVTGQIWIDQLLLPRKDCPFGPGLICIGLSSLHSRQRCFLLPLSFNLELVPFDLDEHFLLHGQVVFLYQLLVLLVVLGLERS